MKTSSLPVQASSSQRLHRLVLAALLCAISIVIPMFMPKFVYGPMSVTPACHTPTFIAMFISPAVAAAVCVGTTIGFFVTLPPIIALRAASHIVFAVVGALLLKKFPGLLKNPISYVIYGIVISILHAVAEVAVVTPFFLGGSLFSAEQLSNGFLMSVVLLVGCVTVLHSMFDYFISLLIWKPVKTIMSSAR